MILHDFIVWLWHWLVGSDIDKLYMYTVIHYSGIEIIKCVLKQFQLYTIAWNFKFTNCRWPRKASRVLSNIILYCISDITYPTMLKYHDIMKHHGKIKTLHTFPSICILTTTLLPRYYIKIPGRYTVAYPLCQPSMIGG